MKYNPKIFIDQIVVEKIGNKMGVAVYFENGEKWIPGLIEQALIAQKVASCEKIKYPNLPWDASLLPIEFLTRAIKGECVCALAYEDKFNLRHTRSYKKHCLKELKGR